MSTMFLAKQRSFCRSIVHAARYSSAAATAPSAPPVKPDIKLIARLRKESQCSITKAREALMATGNNYTSSLEWLSNDAIVSGAKRASKLEGRVAAEGLIGIVVAGGAFKFGKENSTSSSAALGAIVEVNSETDFVSRSEMFTEFVQRVGMTAAMFGSDVPSLDEGTGKSPIVSLNADALANVPVLPMTSASAIDEAGKTVRELQVETIGKLGENIRVRRAAAVLRNDFLSGSDSLCIVGGYAHGGSGQGAGVGRIGALVALTASPASAAETHMKSGTLNKLANQLAQHVVGFNPSAVRDSDLPADNDLESAADSVFLRQTFLPSGGSLSVEQALEHFSTQEPKVTLTIEGFERYECGDGIEIAQNDFAGEVLKQAGL